MPGKRKKSAILAAADAVANSQREEESPENRLRRRAGEIWLQSAEQDWPVLFGTSDPDVVVMVASAGGNGEVRAVRIMRE